MTITRLPRFAPSCSRWLAGSRGIARTRLASVRRLYRLMQHRRGLSRRWYGVAPRQTPSPEEWHDFVAKDPRQGHGGRAQLAEHAGAHRRGEVRAQR